MRSFAIAFFSFDELPIPPRIAKFFDGPELATHADVKAWGMEGMSADTKMKVQWGSNKLARIFEYATEGYFENGLEKRYLPIAALGSETYMFVVDVSASALPVMFFATNRGFPNSPKTSTPFSASS